MNTLGLIAVIAGGFIALQATMNARLGVHFNNVWLAIVYAFFISFILTSVWFAAVYFKTLKSQVILLQLSAVPWYLWFASVFSVLGVGAMYWLIPKMGTGIMMSYALIGQLIVAMLISHFGLFDSPQKLLSISKVIGSILLIVGVVLINKE